MNLIKRIKNWIWPQPTDKEEELFEHLRSRGCPDCGTDSFDSGPAAGLAVNIRCSNPECHSEFNVAPMLRFAERIRYTEPEE